MKRLVQLAAELVFHPKTDPNTGVLCSFLSHERPLKGLAGALDWQLCGLISKWLKMGRIEGSEGELAYIPYRHRDTMRHVLLLGVGSDRSQERPLSFFNRSVKNIHQLGLKHLVISESSFPFVRPADFEHYVEQQYPGLQVRWTQ